MGLKPLFKFLAPRPEGWDNSWIIPFNVIKKGEGLNFDFL